MIILSQTGSGGIFNNIILLLVFLLGNGAGGLVFKYVLEWRRRAYAFDIAMNELMRQNKIRRKEEIIYVPRNSLEKDFKKFLQSDTRICEIQGAAGSGKTRFVLNITRYKKGVHRYYPVYIDKNNGKFFTSSQFVEAKDIKGKRNYVFIFDYVYENKEAIRYLLNLTSSSHKYKYVFVERNYDDFQLERFFDERDCILSMEDYKMDKEMLKNVFINSLPYKERRTRKVQTDASEIINSIIEKIDPEFRRPIFAKLSAEIYKSHSVENFDEIGSSSEIISLYWKNKFNTSKVEKICLQCDIKVNEDFMRQLEILMRVLLLMAAVTKNRITVFKKENLTIIMNERNIYTTVRDFCDSAFLNSLNRMTIDDLKQLFGVALKENIKADNTIRKDQFQIISELDIVSEWIFTDASMKREPWLVSLILFFRRDFKNDFVNFLIRGSLDFPELVEYLQHNASEDMNENEYCLVLTGRINRAYGEENFKMEKVHEKYVLQMLGFAQKTFLSKEFFLVQQIALKKIKECHMHYKKETVTENLLAFWEN